VATEIKIEDLRVGDIITMMKGRPHDTILRDGMLAVATRVHTTEDTFGRGKILRVEGVDLPFVAVVEFNSYSKGFGDKYVHGLDTRDGWMFARISPEYAKAMGYDGPMTAADGTPAQNGGVA